MNREQLKAFIADLIKVRNAATDEVAVDVPRIYPQWNGEGVAYVTGDRVLYADVLYKVLMDHTSQMDWAPDVAPSLFVKVLTDEAGNILPWEQPGATNPYMKGDKVTHNGQTWVSLIDNNVWEPTVGALWEIEE